MRTTLDLPEELLNEAMKITSTGTKTGVIILALRELIRKSKKEKLNSRLWIERMIEKIMSKS